MERLASFLVAGAVFLASALGVYWWRLRGASQPTRRDLAAGEEHADTPQLAEGSGRRRLDGPASAFASKGETARPVDSAEPEILSPRSFLRHQPDLAGALFRTAGDKTPEERLAFRRCIGEYLGRRDPSKTSARGVLAITVDVSMWRASVIDVSVLRGDGDAALVTCLRSSFRWLREPITVIGAPGGTYRFEWPFMAG